MAASRTRRDLVAWQEAMTLVELVYRDTAAFPKQETFGLTAQLRRVALSIPSNLAEGAGRNSSREMYQYLGFTSGSLAEVETQLELAVRLGYLGSNAKAIRQAAIVGKLVNGLRKSINARTTKQGPVQVTSH